MKHSVRTALFCLLLHYGNQAHSQVNSLVDQLHQPKDKRVMVAAHRGDWRNAPENSLRAYELAIEMGVDVIEIDLNKTSDGVIVIMHDETINRTTNGKGKPSDFTLEQLRQFRLRDGLGVLTKHTIPTLEEVMLLAKGKVLVNLDKSYPYYREAYEVLKKTGTLQQAIFKTSEPYADVRTKYGSLLDSITFMPVIDLDEAGALAEIKTYQQAIKPVAFELIFQKDTASILYDHAFLQSKMWINSLWPRLNGGHDDNLAFDEGNTKDSWDWLIAHGATMIQTDRPKTLLAYLKKKSLHP